MSPDAQFCLNYTRTSEHAIPWVIISADATQTQVDGLMADGAFAYLTKLLDLTQFFLVIEQATSGVQEKTPTS
jgi:DNA-binding NtrC family response regulator